MTIARIESPSGLRFEAQSNGAIARIDCGDVTLNTFLGTELEGGPANLYLRLLDGSERAARFIPLLGPQSPARFEITTDSVVAAGSWEGIEFRVQLVLASSMPAWFWHVALRNGRARAARVDLFHAQDLSLAHYGAIRSNEYYTSNYVDWTPLEHPERGVVLAARQNLMMDARHPWVLMGTLGRCASFATDAIQLHGYAARANEPPPGLLAERLENRRLQHEHSMAVIQHSPILLEPARSIATGYFGRFEPHHEAASSLEDLSLVDETLALPEARAGAFSVVETSGNAVAPNLFGSRRSLVALDLSTAEIDACFGRERRQEERNEKGLLSFFTGENRHVVLRAKEQIVLRPHGHILRTGRSLVPDEAALSTTVWMCGVFNSLLTQGHVSINRFVSATHGYLDLFKADGQRIFLETPRGFRLLDLPSAFEMSPSQCRWLYKHDAGLVEVRTSASLERHEIELAVEVLAGAPARFLVSTRVAIDGDDGAGREPPLATGDESGVVVRPRAESEIGQRFPEGFFRIDGVGDTELDTIGGDELLYADGGARGEPLLAILTSPSKAATFRITGHLLDPDSVPVSPRMEPTDDAPSFWKACSGSAELRPPLGAPLSADVARLGEILPWLAHNAFVHYLAPHGLEQYSGGGWGTRDVCQGPVEHLLALGEHPAVRELLLRVFANQNPDGDWPQWFMFFERERNLRASDSHGDIVFWPLLALGEYLVASEDASILDVELPFFDARGEEQAEIAALAVHVARALDLVSRRVIPGTCLAAYGNGDWNDSLQPLDPSMKERLTSAWTVTLHYHTLRTFGAGLRAVERAEDAEPLEIAAKELREDFQRLLVVDGVVAGLASFQEDGRIVPLLHPDDDATGISFSLLPMIHGILHDVFTPAEAAVHREVIRRSLLAADGARLFDVPPRYQGGLQRHFQRAESASFFGREIGVMYMHAHLRYAEAMARYGDADAFFLALRQANPIALAAVVPTARLRQANCYYSSSDATFADRYEARERYADVKSGAVDFEGGWRVYSSGAGIALRLVHERFLGIERRRESLIIDPVIPVSLDRLEVDLPLAGKRVTVRYRTGTTGRGPVSLSLNGTPLAFDRVSNPYRTGGASVRVEAIARLLTGGADVLEISLE